MSVSYRDLANLFVSSVAAYAGYKLYQQSPFLAGVLVVPSIQFGLPFVISAAKGLRASVKGR
ncbi:MAG: hypothetical protein QXR87_03335 [Candidatus Hadarchaeales archaeon]